MEQKTRPPGVPALVPLPVLAEQWQVSPETLRTWARRGQIPSLKIGALIFFEADALARFIEAQRSQRQRKRGA